MRDAAERDVRPSRAPLNAADAISLPLKEDGATPQAPGARRPLSVATRDEEGHTGLGAAAYVPPSPTPPCSPQHRRPSREPSTPGISPRSRTSSLSVDRDGVSGTTVEDVFHRHSRREQQNPLLALFAQVSSTQVGSGATPSDGARCHDARAAPLASNLAAARPPPAAPRGWAHGQITVFSVAHCAGCRKVKALLTAKRWPYVDISLTQYPLVFDALFEFSDRAAVPQVFFNEELIGGVAECEAMNAAGHLDAKYAAMAGTAAPRNSLFSPAGMEDALAGSVAGYPSGSEAAGSVSARRKGTTPSSLGSTGALAVDSDASICIAGECASYAEVLTRLVEGGGVGRGFKLEVVDMPTSLHTRRVRRCFTGKALVDVLLAQWPSLGGRAEAAEVGAQLFETRMFAHLKRTERRVARAQEKLCRQGSAIALRFEFADSENVFYRLQADAVPLVLNSWRVFCVSPGERVDAQEDSAFATIERCRAQLYSIIATHLNAETGRVAYDAVSDDARFCAFEEAACALQAVDIAAMANNARLAFVLNVYNVCILYAFAKLGRPESTLARTCFFNRVACNVGGRVFSFSELESGILRANRPAPFSLAGAPFRRDDPRAAIALPTCDDRIHFALNCGARSCPAISSFTPGAVDRELRIVAFAFCEDEDNIRVDVAKRTVYLSQIFNWCVWGAYGQRLDYCLRCVGALRARPPLSRSRPSSPLHTSLTWYRVGMPSILAIRPVRSCGGSQIGCAANARRSCAACWAMGAGSTSVMHRTIGLRTLKCRVPSSEAEQRATTDR